MNKVFNKAGLRKFWFPVYKMPKNGSDWPTVKKMIRMNQRLIVFTSKATRQASEHIAYEWNYVVENKCESHIYFPLLRSNDIKQLWYFDTLTWYFHHIPLFTNICYN